MEQREKCLSFSETMSLLNEELEPEETPLMVVWGGSLLEKPQRVITTRPSYVDRLGRSLEKGSGRAEVELRQMLDEDVETKFLAYWWLDCVGKKSGKEFDDYTHYKIKKFREDPINGAVAKSINIIKKSAWKKALSP